MWLNITVYKIEPQDTIISHKDAAQQQHSWCHCKVSMSQNIRVKVPLWEKDLED